MTFNPGKPALLCLALSISTAFLGTAVADREEPVELPALTVVTATRSEQPINDTLASVSVITRDDIRRSVAQDLPELLRLQAGVDVVRTGPAGSQTSVFLRGGNSNHVLVLVDGIRVASAHTGTYAWELLPLAAIERIEIVRGPRAAIYGSDAMGGVIQVFTRQLDQPASRLTAGSFGSFEAEAGAGAGNDRGRHSLFAAWRKTEGFSAQREGGYSFDPDNDGMESRSGGINGQFTWTGGTLNYRLLGSQTEAEFDMGVSDARQAMALLSWDGITYRGWDYQLIAGYFDDQLETDYGFSRSVFDSRRFNLSWQNQLQTAVGRLGFGFDYIDETGTAEGSYQANRDNGAGYLTWESAIDRVEFQLSGRLDDNSQFGSEPTWQAAAAVPLFESARVGIQWGTAFRAPDLGEQFSPGFAGLFAGNPNLQPETSNSLELDWQQQVGSAGKYTLSMYRTRVDNLISFSGANFQAVNIDQAELEGLEAEFSGGTAQWNARLNVTLQRTEDKATGTALLRRPDRKGSLTIQRFFESSGWLGLDWFVSGSRLDVGGLTLPGYGLLSLHGGWPVSTSLTAEIRLENLLDQDFEPADGFNGTGRAAYISLDWRR